jgi:hypothetical protein
MNRTPQSSQATGVPSEKPVVAKTGSEPSLPSRRNFIGKVGGATAAAWAASALGLSPLLSSTKAKAAVLHANTSVGGQARRTAAYQLRLQVALNQFNKPLPNQINNGDEKLYNNTFIGQYSKALRHTTIGDPDPGSYRKFLSACQTGTQSSFEACTLGGTVPLTSPQGGLAYALIGADEGAVTIPPAPTLASAERAGEMVENYWQALCRDVPFDQYGLEPLTQAAIADLNKLSDFTGPKVNGQVTPGTLFRGFTAGDLIGPYVSQFFMQPVNGLGDFSMRDPLGNPAQLYLSYVPGLDYMTDEASWLAVQNGQATVPTKARTIFFAFGPNTYNSSPGPLHDGRDMAGVVHTDELYQHPFWAACEMLGAGFPANPGNPYSATKTPNEVGFSAWGGPMFTGLLGHVALQAAQAVWYQKFYVHRPLRPEEYSGRVQNLLTGKGQYPLQVDVLNSAAVQQVFSKHGTYYLPMAYPEGCPTHPSYGSGHATVAAACCTMLKALFNGATSFTSLGITPMYSPDGVTLQPYTGADVDSITVETELNKMASNIGVARNIAGVHWRSDYTQSLNLGEAVAIAFLQDMVHVFNEVGGTFQFNKFDGTPITISR